MLYIFVITIVIFICTYPNDSVSHIHTCPNNSKLDVLTLMTVISLSSNVVPITSLSHIFGYIAASFFRYSFICG